VLPTDARQLLQHPMPEFVSHCVTSSRRRVLRIQEQFATLRTQVYEVAFAP